MTETEKPDMPGAGDPVDDIYPLTPLQAGMLFHLLREPDSVAYLSQKSMCLNGIDVDLVRQAWQLLTQRHPVLRTGILWGGDNEPVQVVYRRGALPVKVIDLRRSADPARDAAEFLATDRLRGFGVDDVPLARVALLQLSDERLQMVWTHHGFVLDGWSSGLIWNDLATVMGALMAGINPPPQTTLPMRHYLTWLHGHLDSDAEPYWRSVVGDLDETTPLPLAGSATDGETGFAVHEIRVDAATSARINAAGRALGVPFSAVAQAAWALTLSRYGRIDEVVFGLVGSGRSIELRGIERVVGALTNTVPVRIRVTPGETVGSWLRRISETHMVTMRHQHTPLSEVQRWSGLPNGAAMFDTVLLVQNLPERDGGASGAGVENIETYEAAPYPVEVFLVPGNGLTIRLCYNRAFLSEHSAIVLAESIRGALIGLAGPAEATLETIKVFPSEHAADGPRRDYSVPGTLVAAFDQQVAALPDATAVMDGPRRISYRELDARSECLADRLVASGVVPEQRVAVVLGRSIECVVAVLAVLKAGGCYVPVDPDLPASRIAYLLDDSACSVAVTRSDARSVLPQVPAERMRVVCVDETEQAADQALAVRRSARPDNLAYLVYTSGSTGLPKAVMVSHRAVLNTFRWLSEEFSPGPGDVVAHKVPVGFTDAVFEMLWPLCNGAALAVIDDTTAKDPSALSAELRVLGVTYSQLVPRQIQAFATDSGNGILTDPLPALKWVINGAEPLPASFAVAWDERFEHARIANIYGMTESAIFATSQTMPSGLAAELGTVPIGRPIANTTAHVLDPALHPCAVGVVGELYLGGVGIARGYLNRPALTAERFVPNPAGVPGARLYRTGDTARRLADGTFDYVGRTDFQIKVRGIRVEPAEVETALREHPAVQDCVAVASDDRLVAYVVMADGVDPALLRDWMAQHVPPALVPGTIVRLSRLPMTSRGKVDRRALPDAVRTDRPTAASARDPLEEALVGVWQELLRTPVGIHDDFNDLGGDSLLAVRVVGQIRDLLPVNYTVTALFQHPTVAGSAAVISDLLATDDRIEGLLAEVAGPETAS